MQLTLSSVCQAEVAHKPTVQRGPDKLGMSDQPQLRAGSDNGSVDLNCKTFILNPFLLRRGGPYGVQQDRKEVGLSRSNKSLMVNHSVKARSKKRASSGVVDDCLK